MAAKPKESILLFINKTGKLLVHTRPNPSYRAL